MIDALLGGIEALVVGALNALLAALGAMLAALVELLPEMPALPGIPAPMTTALAWVSWAFPVSTLLDVLAFVLAMWLLWQLVSIGLRWAKAIDG